ncbi:MAG: ABC transporter permease subunit [Clostridia bacterium]|nr:ABC transporter permease subunit [Clostridia bacterium]
MKTILKRELRAYFLSPIGYTVIAVMYFFSSYYFFTYNLFGNTTDTSTMFSMLFSVAVFLVPILTMRLLSEERRAKTEQTLWASPVSRLGVVLGKYIAALILFLIAISGTLMAALVMQVYAHPSWPVVMANYLGLSILGSALIGICLFISALTESQVTAAVAGFGVSLFLILADALRYVVRGRALRAFVSFFAFQNRYRSFTVGIVDFTDVVFFVSFAWLFIALTAAVLERRRWA